MLDHVSIGVRDIAKAKGFYDAALKPLGIACLSADEGSLGYGREGVGFWINSAERPVADDPKSAAVSRALPPRTGRASQRFMPPRSRMADVTTASPDCARTTGRTTTPPTCSTRRAIGSKPISGGNKPMATVRSELTTQAPAGTRSGRRSATSARSIPGSSLASSSTPGSSPARAS